ncbi:MAG: WD40 repeat domain-containing protein [Deltaproteobacteria bacterium]|nr:WD40 repeat domain-containing protein [Deltaproteobacteria bacterium]
MQKNIWFIILVTAVVIATCVGCETPTPSPTPSSTPSPTPSPIPSPTPSPTPDLETILEPLAAVARGQGVPEARPYTPEQYEQPRFWILDIYGEPHPWNEKLPTNWLPTSLDETDLVIIVWDQAVKLDKQEYTDGASIRSISRYRWDLDVVIREAHTGDTLWTTKMSGGVPPFPERIPADQRRLDGNHVSYVKLEEWVTSLSGPLGWSKPSVPNINILEHTDIVWSVAFSPDGKTIASGSKDRKVQLWGSQTCTLNGHWWDVYSVAFSPDGEILASAGQDKKVRLWQVEDCSNVLTFEAPEQIYNLAFSPDGELLATGSWTKPVRLWRVADGALLRTLEGGSVAFSPDGELLAAGAWTNNTVRLWRVADGALLHTLEAPTDSKYTSVYSAAFSPNGEILASGSEDKTVRLWRVEDGALLRTLEGHTGAVNSVAFSPDGKLLASGSEDNTVQLWRVEDGALLYTLEGHTDDVSSVAFSPDGELLASGSRDKTVRLWRVESLLE